MASSVPFRDVVAYAIGGGWGSDNPTDGAVPISIIRGTDFANLQSGNARDVPLRYESNAKAEKRILCPGDVVLEISGGSPTSGQSTGRTLLMKESILADLGSRVIPASFCRLVRFDTSKVDPRYAYYALQDMYHSGRAAEYEHRSTGISNFQFEYFLDQEVIRLVPLPEQRAIAHILGTLDDKIELNRRMSETLEAIARALFKSWFVDFDPVRAKAEGRDPGLPAHLADLYPDSFEDSELGEIPAWWRVGPVDDAFDLTMGQSPPGETYNENGDGLPFFQGRADFTFRFPTRRVYCTAPTRCANQGDTLVSVRAPVGDINMAVERCAIGRGVAAVRHKTGGRSFTFYSMRSLGYAFAKFEADGTVFGSISKTDFHSLATVVPNPAVVRAFERTIGPFDDKIEGCEHESRTLVALRDTLLSKLISGDLQISRRLDADHPQSAAPPSGA